MSKYPFPDNDYLKFEWYVDERRRAWQSPVYAEALRQSIRTARQEWGEKALLYTDSRFLNYELGGLMDPLAFTYHIFDCPDKHLEMVDRFKSAELERLRRLLQTDVDMIRHITHGLEVTSMDIFKKYILPEAVELRQHIHAAGKLFFIHCCGKTRQLIENGFYNEIAPDLFETLSGPPAGTIDDLRAIRQKLGPRMCTRGNLSLDLLRQGTAQQVADAARKIIADVSGYRHFLGTSDCGIFDGTPHENIEALLNAVKTYYGG